MEKQKQMGKQKQTNGEKISELRDIRELVTTGRVEKDKIIKDFKFHFHTLTVAEQTEVLNDTALRAVAGDTLPKANIVVQETLVRAIDTVNGIPLEKLYNSSSEIDLAELEKKRVVVGGWQATFLFKINFEFQKLVEESNQKVADLGN